MSSNEGPPAPTASPTCEGGVGGDFLSVDPCQAVLQPFQDRWRELAAEALSLDSTDWLDHPDRHVARFGWQLAPIRYFDANHPNGELLAPLLAEIVHRDPRVHAAGYFTLAPGTELAPHRGNPVGLARFHLGLSIPDGCGIQVGTTSLTWEEGEWLAFDDSKIHRAWNHGDRPRYVLILDLEHPAVPVPAGAHAVRWASRTFYLSVQRFPRLQVLLGRMSWLSRLAQLTSAGISRFTARRRRTS